MSKTSPSAPDLVWKEISCVACGFRFKIPASLIAERKDVDNHVHCPLCLLPLKSKGGFSAGFGAGFARITVEPITRR